MKNKQYWIARIREHLADLAHERCPAQRERIMRRIGFATRKADQ